MRAPMLRFGARSRAMRKNDAAEMSFSKGSNRLVAVLRHQDPVGGCRALSGHSDYEMNLKGLVARLPSGQNLTEESAIGFLSVDACANLRDAHGNIHHNIRFGSPPA